MVLYELELEKLISTINNKKYNRIMIQLPDGLKHHAKEITDLIREKTNCEVLIWMGSCYGACDIPQGINLLGVDMFVQWGHNIFRKINGW